MRTTIDSGGRVVVPKKIRDAMGLEPGSKVDIVFTDGRIEIEAVHTEVELELDEDGFPVLRAPEGTPALTADAVRELMEAERDERDARLV